MSNRSSVETEAKLRNLTLFLSRGQRFLKVASRSYKATSPTTAGNHILYSTPLAKIDIRPGWRQQRNKRVKQNPNWWSLRQEEAQNVTMLTSLVDDAKHVQINFVVAPLGNVSGSERGRWEKEGQNEFTNLGVSATARTGERETDDGWIWKLGGCRPRGKKVSYGERKRKD